MSKWQVAPSRGGSSQPLLTDREAGRGGLGILGEDGATLVEMAICSSTLLCMIFGVIYFSMALYTYNYVDEAAREATRWAMVRGSQSCSNTPNLSDCNATAAQITAFVTGLGGIDSSRITAIATWCAQSTTTPGTWAACAAGTPNTPGNEVRVQVQYNFPLNVPFWNSSILTVASTSTVVISQ